ncbi:MAG: UDP-N-acetylmuramoylalanyl-D-glutamyl-2,6-diaminopimelate/D-alanyl-D-alanyl ligase [Massilibacillus sp.]|jgi:UDP-N-acetylmuramoyl-tripeptide--D-alanyl-D-alanine ligase|nr:UDP-N-acetylmuramoylalanyl-D-glutamyl-2,6-diaminopimelate/D-alanyl-D-alanyl ligase [Massilibacillus sp.]
MLSFTVENVKIATAGIVVKTVAHNFTKVVTDTRLVKEGALFIALIGDRFDGHVFVHQAIEKGAAGIIVSGDYTAEELAQLNVTIIKVNNTLTAYQQLAKLYRDSFAIPVIAITGSNGKTTTKDLTAAVLSSKFNVLKTKANYNNEIGLPLTLFSLTEDHEVAVVEMGMRGFGQIEELVKIATPTIGIVTNVGETHMELLGSLENIAKAKGELVEAMDANGVVILNVDNSYVCAMQAKAKGKVILFGFSEAADVKASNVKINGQETMFDCSFSGATYSFVVPMVGRHNVYNALAAIAVGFELGLTAEEMQSGLADFTASGMRLAIGHVGDYTVINDAYNASPMSMMAAIEALKEVANNRCIAVLGDMLELGDIAVEAHANIGVKLAEKKIDAVVTIGEMAKYIASSALENGVLQVVACDNHSQAGLALKDILQAGDSILVKGSRGMQMEKVIELI